MTTEKLAAMANQIALYFQSYPDDRAIEGVAKHIQKFWTPRMRDTLRAAATATPAALDALVVAAMTGAGRVRAPAE
jgi:formate dehydrogenase subunit delta